MNVEVVTPEEYLGCVLSDLTVARNAAICEVVSKGQGLSSRHMIHCDVPLARLLGYSTDLRSLTSGEGQFTMQYSHHAEIDAIPEEGEEEDPRCCCLRFDVPKQKVKPILRRFRGDLRRTVARQPSERERGEKGWGRTESLLPYFSMSHIEYFDATSKSSTPRRTVRRHVENSNAQNRKA